MEKYKWGLMVIFLVILVLMHGSATKLKAVRNIKLQGGVAGNANFDGSANIIINTTQTNIKVLTGSLELNANTSSNASEGHCTFTEKVVNYPEGFTKDNCIVVNYSRRSVRCDGYGWNNYPNSIDILEGTLPMTVALYSDNSSLDSTYRSKIRIRVGNLSTNTQTITYMIILMKIK